VGNAEFNGANLLDGSTAQMGALANASGTSALTVQGEDLSLSGSVVTVGSTATIGTATAAASMITVVQASLDNVSASLSRLGTSSKAFSMHQSFVSKLQDTIDAGVGNLVDADLAKESAKFQALQTKQQLGIQALSIANQAPQSILSLFK
jgi:flagellin